MTSLRYRGSPALDSATVTDKVQVNEQIDWSLKQVLRNDPIRRFVYGVTICNLEMRVWYGDRSNVAVSKPLDLVEVRASGLS